MNFFKPYNFGPLFSNNMAIAAAKEANAKLEREGKVVYTMADSLNDSLWVDKKRFDSCGKPAQNACKQTALLINIEPIESKPTYEDLEKELFILKTQIEIDKGLKKMVDRMTCYHPEDKIREIPGASFSHYECQCGAKLKPKTFEEV